MIRLIFTSLFLMLGLLTPGFSQVGSTGCTTAPAPTNLGVTSVTATSITVAWNAPPMYSHYKMDVVDLDAGITYPSEYGIGNEATKNGLLPNHNHSITIRLSQSPVCPYGDPSTTDGQTGIIILELVMARGCTLNGGMTGLSGIEITLPNTPVTETNPSYVAAIEHNTKIGTKTLNITMNYTYSTDQRRLFAYFNAAPGMETDPGHTLVRGAEANKFYYKHDGRDIIVGTLLEMTTQVCRVFLAFPNGISNYKTCAAQRPAQEPRDIKLLASPNPFQHSFEISYQLEEAAHVKAMLINAQGQVQQMLESGNVMDAGTHHLHFEGAGLPQGVYFLVLQVDGERKTYTLVKE